MYLNYTFENSYLYVFLVKKKNCEMELDSVKELLTSKDKLELERNKLHHLR